jgi:hypothetical protein
MAASDARFVPVRNAAYRVTFPILDADGDLVAGAASLDSEVSKDGGTFADCTNEATEIAAASGMYFLDLTATEMDADTVAVIVKTGTAGAKTTPIVLYTAARDVDDLAFPTVSGRSIDVTATGEVGVDLDNAAGTLDAAQFGAGFITSTKFAAGAVDAAAIADGAIDAATFAAGAITAAAVATDAIGAAELAADAVTEIANAVAAPAAATIADAVWDETRAGHVTAGTFGEGAASVQGNVTGSVASVVGAVGSVTAPVTVGANGDKTGYSLSAAGVDAILDDSLSELAAAPAATPTLRQALQWLYQMFRNRVTATAAATTVQNGAGTTIATAPLSDDGTTFTRGGYS